MSRVAIDLGFIQIYWYSICIIIGMSIGMWFVFKEAKRKHINEDVYQKDLERALNLRRATISGILGTMEKNGFIERTIDDKDTRVKKITLSNKALDRYYKGKEYIEHIENTVLKGISDEELKVFNNVLEKMTLNLKTNT